MILALASAADCWRGLRPEGAAPFFRAVTSVVTKVLITSSLVMCSTKATAASRVPAFLFLILFLYYPFVQNIINSFSDITGLGAPASGLNTPWYANYVTLFSDPKLRTALGNTVLLTVCTVVFQVGIALILALLVDSIRVGAQLFRTLYFFPIVISATALGLMFNLIFLYNGGMLNQLLTNLGLITENIDWKDPPLVLGHTGTKHHPGQVKDLQCAGDGQHQAGAQHVAQQGQGDVAHPVDPRQDRNLCGPHLLGADHPVPLCVGYPQLLPGKGPHPEGIFLHPPARQRPDHGKLRQGHGPL